MAKEKKDNRIEPIKKKRKKMIILKYFIILLVIGLIAFITYRYTEEAKESSYLEGGQSAIAMITEVAQNKGGVAITGDNQTIVLSKYNKITAAVIEQTTPTEEPVNQTTNQTE